MSIQVTVPNLPESVQNATLSEWRKQPGEPVSMGDTLVELETDKVVLDVPAPQDGVVLQHLRNKGDVVTSGEMLAIIEDMQTAHPPAPEANPTAPTVQESATAPVPTEALREETLHI
jgi:2-oxoglutarate dehydrogenase E2 component (dihydrolipoamide succinyltransferase)